MKRNMYKTQIVNQMNENYSNPKTFWSLLNKLKPNKAADNVHPSLQNNGWTTLELYYLKFQKMK